MYFLTFAKGREAVPVADGQANSFAGADQRESDVAAEGALAVDDVTVGGALDLAVFGSRNGAAAAHLADGLLAGPGAVLLAEADAGSDQLVAAVAADAAGPVEDAVARLFDEVAVGRRVQLGAGQQLTRPAAVLLGRHVAARALALGFRRAARR